MRPLRGSPALQQPYESHLNEDYYIIQIHEALDETGKPRTAAAMFNARGGQAAQIVRGDSMPLSHHQARAFVLELRGGHPGDRADPPVAGRLVIV